MDVSRFSIITDEVSQDLPVVARFVRDFGLPGFELRSLFGRAFKDLTVRDVAEVRALAEGEGWRVHGCCTPVFKCELDDAAAIREHGEIFRRSLDVARELRCDLVRVFTFLRRPETLTPAIVARIADHLTGLAALAAAAQLRLGIENEASCRIGTGGEMLQLGSVLTHPAAGWIWDPCNVLYLPEVGPATAEFGALLPRIFHLHLKDASRTPGAATPARAMPLGDGDVGWGRHLAEIRRSSYRGLLSLETHWRREALDEKVLHLPAGHAFSAGGEEASRICLPRLFELWAAAG